MSKLSETRRRINAMGMAEAQEELKTLRRRLFELRLQLARGEVKNNRQFPQIKADVARLMYRMSELNRMGPEEEEAEGEAEGETEAESAAEPVAEASAPQARARRPRRAAQTTQAPTTTAATEVEAAEEPEESVSEAEERASEETE